MSKALPVSALLEAMAETLSAADIVAASVKAKISSQISKWRISHQMTQAEFADFMGVTQSQVSKWENGDCNFSVEKLSDIACHLDLRLDVSFIPEMDAASLQESIDTASNGISNVVYICPPFADQLMATASTDLAYGHQQDCFLDLMEG